MNLKVGANFKQEQEEPKISVNNDSSKASSSVQNDVKQFVEKVKAVTSVEFTNASPGNLTVSPSATIGQGQGKSVSR